MRYYSFLYIAMRFATLQTILIRCYVFHCIAIYFDINQAYHIQIQPILAYNLLKQNLLFHFIKRSNATISI